MKRASSRSSTLTKDGRRFRTAVAKLRRHFGPQGWWPRVLERGTWNVDHRKEFEVRHHPGDPSRWVARTEADRAFEVAVGAILTQNTAWSNVEKALVCLASRRLLTSRSISRASVRTIQACVRPSGYFRQKAKKLKGFACFVEKDLKGDLRNVLKRPVPRSSLIAQWGIGPETADTILLYGLDMPSFVVDAYTRRLLVEMTGSRRWLARPYEDVRLFCEDAAPRSVRGWQEAHACIVTWGKSQHPIRQDP